MWMKLAAFPAFSSWSLLHFKLITHCIPNSYIFHWQYGCHHSSVVWLLEIFCLEMHPSKIASNSFGFARKSSMLGIHEGFSFPCFSVGSDDAAVVGTKLFKAKCCVLPRKKELNNTTPCLSLAFLKEEDSLRRKTILRSVWLKERTVLYSNHLTSGNSHEY